VVVDGAVEAVAAVPMVVERHPALLDAHVLRDVVDRRGGEDVRKALETALPRRCAGEALSPAISFT
jgi:hypothetical protein